ncbi:MAG TPA: PhzF family phenazine biosynthesis protein [Actinocrinis sp.]|nr:PhzF family phenazine biosynthesis protein [Actinocrinis sp.]
MRRPFKQVDVFTAEPYRGNPVAVVLDASGLDVAQMQRFAQWTNLSETTFVLPPSSDAADYRVRIFTPARELPFAGHPTLGTCHAWLEAGGTPRTGGITVQECEAGLIRVRDTGAGLAFPAPPLLRSGPVEEEMVERIASVLRIGRSAIVDSQWADNGPGWVAVLLESADAVLALDPGLVDFDLGVAGLTAPGSAEAVEVRTFFPHNGATTEDPVTGSFIASLSQWLLAGGRVTAPYVVRQGTALGRAGRATVTVDAATGVDRTGEIWVGGSSVTCVSGHVEL